LVQKTMLAGHPAAIPPLFAAHKKTLGHAIRMVTRGCLQLLS